LFFKEKRVLECGLFWRQLEDLSESEGRESLGRSSKAGRQNKSELTVDVCFHIGRLVMAADICFHMSGLVMLVDL